ncbi:CAP domain-containing protein [Roseovarius tibetensis]|uniref:CAP domain-containing protein n=1 Tax=Roseovarius tibetensis TaxID=2685897 RepID=UPI003D7F5281
MELTENEQLFLELVNRARLDPAGEAARYNIGLNDPDANTGDAPSPVLTADPKQPLAHNSLLSLASERHSEDMLDRNYFEHIAPDTSDDPAPDGAYPRQRIEAAGYDLIGAWGVGENLAWSGTTGTLDLDARIVPHYEGLFKSTSHRQNILNDGFRETGIAQVEGVFQAEAADGNLRDFNASMLTHKFATSGSDIFLTGVAYDDLDGDDFYSRGEAKAGVAISSAGETATTATAGGYALALDGNTTQTVVTWDGGTHSATVDMDGRNAKVDIVGGTRILSSTDLTLGAGVTEGGLLGVGTLILTGNDLDNLLIAGRGDNTIDGATGYDIARFSGIKADYDISDGGASTIVTDTRTDGLGDGSNTLTSIEKLIFEDGYHLFSGDGPIRLTGQLRDAAGDDMVGSSVEFTPQGDPTPKWGMSTDGNGQFDLGLVNGAEGRLDARLDVGEGDPAITAGDALNVLRIAVGLEPSFGPAQAQNFVAADLNGDQKVTAGDALEVLRHAVGLESQHAPEWAFFDADTDWQSLALDKDSITVERGVEIASLGADQDIAMTGILLGNMDTV